MLKINVKNPWGAPVFYFEKCGSTMDEARRLEKQGAPCGSVIAAAFQTEGRGRFKERRWQSESGGNLLFTLLLRYNDFNAIPKAWTLKTGVAIALALEKMFPALAGKLNIKWPNDIMLSQKKICGILTESDGKNVFCGIGLNLLNKNADAMPGAASLFKEISVNKEQIPSIYGAHFELILEEILKQIKIMLEDGDDWHAALNKRLFGKGEEACFLELHGGEKLRGIVCGVSPAGALIIEKADGAKIERVSGELTSNFC
ncbi:MAG: biotin--[acetyl-CoA-carboxylase] ligase [Spirochaetaceae bacterium]|jgi:BirA family biotin operon repressor/biotin-[acetyl-CoA-carboxylase] ligase|nr:biotin--[acetyl-CoA-carboxylase] ligase [Spirochaetaceae bacterium]